MMMFTVVVNGRHGAVKHTAGLDETIDFLRENCYAVDYETIDQLAGLMAVIEDYETVAISSGNSVLLAKRRDEMTAACRELTVIGAEHGVYVPEVHHVAD